jgi:hypothetical protein
MSSAAWACRSVSVLTIASSSDLLVSIGAAAAAVGTSAAGARADTVGCNSTIFDCNDVQ